MPTRTTLAVVAGVTLAAAAILPTTTAQAAQAGSSCTSVTVRQRVAVHYDPNFTSRVVRSAPKGEHDTVCLVAIGRGEQYTACGRRGWDWDLVRGGYIPDVCATPIP
ncbi:hypothetical protein [Streptomyces sp. CA2R106]|uniref:hypothetical protein n=1 Tax=Streptomyces sp. CA2R106 TaxID=3120153 RepID=UPI003008123C